MAIIYCYMSCNMSCYTSCHLSSDNNNNNLYLVRVNTYVMPYGLVGESTLIFPRDLTCKYNYIMTKYMYIYVCIKYFVICI